MSLYKALSVLLCYPEPELIDAIDDVRDLLADSPTAAAMLEPLLLTLEGGDLISLQERYVQTFDRNPSQSLHLFEHIHGEDRSRGQAMVDLIEEYRRHDFEPVTHELPDYVPLFLEFLSICEPGEAGRLLGDAIHVLAHVGQKLRESLSPYAGVMDVLVCGGVAGQQKTP